MLNGNRTRRILDEYKDLRDNPILNSSININLENQINPFIWKVVLIGPPDTPYNRGLFIISIQFPDNYPYSPPKIKFKTPIYHVNVNSGGGLSQEIGKPMLSILRLWKPEYKIKDVLVSVYSLFYMNNNDCAFSPSMSEELRNNKPLYEEKIKYFTRKYADITRGANENLSNWDFTYNN